MVRRLMTARQYNCIECVAILVILVLYAGLHPSSTLQLNGCPTPYEVRVCLEPATAVLPAAPAPESCDAATRASCPFALVAPPCCIASTPFFPPPPPLPCLRLLGRDKFKSFQDSYCGLCILALYFMYLMVVKGALSVFDCSKVQALLPASAHAHTFGWASDVCFWCSMHAFSQHCVTCVSCCSQNKDGVYILDADPSIRCDEVGEVWNNHNLFSCQFSPLLSAPPPPPLSSPNATSIAAHGPRPPETLSINPPPSYV